MRWGAYTTAKLWFAYNFGEFEIFSWQETYNDFLSRLARVNSQKLKSNIWNSHFSDRLEVQQQLLAGASFYSPIFGSTTT